MLNYLYVIRTHCIITYKDRGKVLIVFIGQTYQDFEDFQDDRDVSRLYTFKTFKSFKKIESASDPIKIELLNQFWIDSSVSFLDCPTFASSAAS